MLKENAKSYELRIKLTSDLNVSLSSCEGIIVDECITCYETKNIDVNEENYEKLKLFLEGAGRSIKNYEEIQEL